MREVGILIWVVFLIVGVIGSMVSSARRQIAAKPPQRSRPSFDSAPGDSAQQRLVAALQARLEVPPPSRPAPVRPAPPRPAPTPPRVVPALRREPPPTPEAHRVRRRSFFGTGPELVRAVIAAEVLGKPRGLNDEYR